MELYAAAWRQAELHALIHIPLGKGFSAGHCEEAAWTYQSILTDLSSYFSYCCCWVVLEASQAAVTLITVSIRNIQKSFWLYSNMTRKNTPRFSYRSSLYPAGCCLWLMGEQRNSLVPSGQSPWQRLAECPLVFAKPWLVFTTYFPILFLHTTVIQDGSPPDFEWLSIL